jgi:branched-chain amino acid transport system ATP-binding protein
MSEPLLTVNKLEVVYQRAITAVQGITLSVREGQIVGILGTNGAGKTTLLRAISGFHGIDDARVTEGSIRFKGRRIENGEPHRIARAGIAIVPERDKAFPNLTVAENLAVGGIARSDRDEIQADAERWLARFPILGERSDQLAGTLSGGEQQQLAIARALMSRPRMLLLDEPSLGLAPIFVDRIFELVQELRDEGVTVLLVEQNVHRALDVADRASVLSVGSVVASGATDELVEGELERSYLGIGEAG